MIKKIRSFLGLKQKAGTTDFSDFFHHASSEEKTKVFREVLRGANEDQRKLVERYDREIANKAAT